MDFKQIKELINLVNKTKISELKIQQGDFKINIRSKSFTKAIQSSKDSSSSAIPISVAQPVQRAVAPAPVQQVATAGAGESLPKDKAADSPSANDNLITIKSPMIGTFYRSSGPDKDPFVKIGDNIDTGSVLCIVEAMKLFNEIEAEVSGKIVKVLVENNSPVEYDQPLFLVEPI